jgi:enolase
MHSSSSSFACTALSTGVPTERFLLAQDTQLCGNLSDLSMHYNSMSMVDPVNGKNMQVCAYCKQKCSHKCGLCGKTLHLTKPRNLPKCHNSLFHCLS